MDLSRYENRHPAVKSIMQWFSYGHLPHHLQEISGSCAELAEVMAHQLPDGPELTAGLRKLLEAKDCFVRASVEAAQTKAAE